MTYSLKSNALDLMPSMGGPTQRIARLGDRFTLAFSARSMSPGQAAQFVSQLNLGLSDKVRMPIPQGFAVGSPGSPVVNGAGQSGRTLVIRGFSDGYVIEPGQFFSLITNGIRYLFQVTAGATADGSGNATVAILPMLRAPPSDGDVCEFAVPQIEGFLSGNSNSWVLNIAGAVSLNFTISEAN